LLVPLFREANVAADLIAALSRLDYPKDRLEILLLLEADDADTIAAIAAAMPAHPSPFRIVLIPFSHPRTKPKALNFALPFCAGEFIAVYDAEDRPHPQQLHAALAAFQAGAADLACVQAPLLTDNAHASWIAGQFSLEYAIHFTQVIALFARLRLPLPLGGTSNHFRKWALVAAGGWDPYNVTEDADLGYRLARAGYRIGAIAPPTFEEAPARLSGWTRQRSRWIKGHLQTWLLLMRAPGRTMAEMGVIGFWAMQLGLAGGLLAAFLHAPMLALLLLSPLLPGAQLDPIDWALAAAGFFAAWSCALCAAYRCQDPGLVRHALTMPVYWPLTFLPGLIALIELVARPHYWAKTDHALTARTAPAHAGRPHP
jgi:cellulose synthase/poly-beta-1,6-N-acetylglucosamine synthase-like glycosyltransferase